MSAGTKATAAAQEAEPTYAPTTMPVWLIVLMFLLFFWGALYFDQHSGWFEPKVYGPYVSIPDLERFQPRSSGDAALIRGKLLFEANCALCHGADGAGKPNQAPPLAGSEWVNTEGPNRLIRIPLAGLSGPIEVKGQPFNLAMAAMGASYPPEDLAAILSYIRQAWGNKAPAVTPEQVAAVKADLKGRVQPYTVDELKSLSEK